MVVLVLLNHYLVAIVGLEETFYQVNETIGTMEVCAVVYEPQVECPIQIDFNVTFETRAETAGTYVHT